MIRSMTGFGQACFEIEEVVFGIEVRSVNHRHLDFRVRLPKQLSALEQEIRNEAQKVFSRGKVDMSVMATGGRNAGSRVQIDQAVAREYIAVAEAFRKEHALERGLDVADLLSLPGVIRLEDIEFTEDLARDALLVAAREAFEATDAMRTTEGANLDRELRDRFEGIREKLSFVSERSATVEESSRQRLRKRAEQLKDETGVLDEARLHQEIVYWADRLDITEELVRLRSHGDQFVNMLEEAEVGTPVGRKLDFLIQEIGREINTIGSKANDGPIAHAVVELKTELERIREQVQNIE